MVNDVEYLFMCSLAIHISSSMEYLFKSLAYFYVVLFHLLMSCISPLYMLGPSPLPDMCVIAKFFSNMNSVFVWENIFNFGGNLFIIFSFMIYFFASNQRNVYIV